MSYEEEDTILGASNRFTTGSFCQTYQEYMSYEEEDTILGASNSFTTHYRLPPSPHPLSCPLSSVTTWSPRTVKSCADLRLPVEREHINKRRRNVCSLNT